MKRYEYKVVKIKASSWWGATAAAQEEQMDTLNREGRSGWRLVVTHQPGPVPLNSLLLEREID